MIAIVIRLKYNWIISTLKLKIEKTLRGILYINFFQYAPIIPFFTLYTGTFTWIYFKELNYVLYNYMYKM